MKELSIEEKAKRYDEAIKVARQYYKDKVMPIGTNFKLEKMFPELRDSKDERIRKGIIKSIMDLNTDWLELHGVSSEEALAWLEKQGEQKSAWSEEDEKMYNDICFDIERAHNNTYMPELIKRYSKQLDWFKSLRYGYIWKPSDEQMDMLKIAVSTSNSIVLDSLYNDLMKLKE